MTQNTALSILLVDDEVEFVSTLAERLELRGYKTATVHDGEDALVHLSAHPADMVLLDVMLPGMHGIEVLRRIRALFPQIPVILLTGQAGARDGIEGMKQGAKGYLSKPVDLNELLELVVNVQSGTGAVGGAHA
jgi:Response regulator containing CheY-like receiver, AAA-type ATPase, and DNA-binding domains